MVYTYIIDIRFSIEDLMVLGIEGGPVEQLEVGVDMV